jgi:predicted PurR-regulated permease PerM
MQKSEERLLAYRRTITIIAVILVLYLSYMIIKPFLVAIAGAAVLAYLFYPFYKSLAKRIPAPLPGESLSAFITVILILLIIMIPISFITSVLAAEAYNGYVSLKTILRQPGFAIKLPAMLESRINTGDLQILKDPLLNLAGQLVLWLQGVVKSVPGAFFGVFITLFTIYYFLKGGKGLYAFLRDFFPLPAGRYKEIFERFDGLSRGMVSGQLLVGVIHGFLAWFAYNLVGVPNPVLWAFVTAIISIIPVLGAGLVWGPIAIYLFVTGTATGTYWKGIVLLIYGLLAMSGIDNALKPKIIGDHARVHPLIILFGILGGIQFFGLPGILLGPMVLALFDVVMGIFREVV